MSSSNIIVRVRYKTLKNRTKGITNWSNYVSKKEKADSLSLEQSNVLNEYLNYSDNKSFLYEKDESFLWNNNGNAIVKQDLKNIKIDPNGVIWDMVISFPQDFAFEKGLITKNDFYELTKNIMPTFLTDLGFDLNNVSWYAGLHRNTNNPHIHLMFYENKIKNHFKVIPNSYIYKLKSYIANYLVDNKNFYELRDKEFKKITGSISLKELTKLKEQKLFSDNYRKQLNKLLVSLYEDLPKQGRLQYNSKNIEFCKDKLNAIIDFILLNEPIKGNYQVYYNILEEHQKELNSVYGSSLSNQNNKYVKDQVNRLYSKIGNQILNDFKKYQSKDKMSKEIIFMKKNIFDLNFKSRNYAKTTSIVDVGKALYKICMLCELTPSQTKRVFKNWINNSKYKLDVDYLISVSSSFDSDMSSAEYYNSLKKLGYDFERLRKIKEKNFYKDLNYKKLINGAINHLMYEYEKEQKEIERDMTYELEGL